LEPCVRDGVGDGPRRPYDLLVPEGRLFLLGDHRVESRYSRAFFSVIAIEARTVERRPAVLTRWWPVHV